MSNFIAHTAYASLYTHPDDEYAVNFYVYLHEDVANEMINRHTKLTDQGKKSLLKKVKSIRDGLVKDKPDIFDAYKSPNCAALFKVNYDGVWTNNWAGKFITIYRIWKYAIISAGGTIMMVPGERGSRDDPDILEKAFTDAEKDINKEFEESQKETAPESSGKWRPLIFEENIPKDMSFQILDWAKTLYKNQTKADFEVTLSSFAMVHKLRFTYTDSLIYVMWADSKSFFENEKKFIEKHKRLSSGCQRMKEAVPPQNPDDVKAMEDHLAKVLKQEDERKKKEAEEAADKERMSKISEERESALERENAIIKDANKLIDEFLKDHQDKTKAINDEKVVDELGKFAVTDSGKKLFTVAVSEEEILAAVKGALGRKKNSASGSGGASRQKDKDYTHIVSEGSGNHDPSFTGRLKLSEKMTNFLAIPLPGKISIGMTGEKFKNYKPDVQGVRAFLKDNGHDETDLSDVVYGIIVTELIDYGAILINDDSQVPTDIPPSPNSQVIPFRIKYFSTLARRVVDSAVFYMCQGARGGSISWYESFKEVSGTFLSEKRFMALCDQVISSGFLSDYVKTRSVGYMRSVNNLFKYRLTRMSTPGLIFRALGMVSHPKILRMIDADQLAVYYRFYKAGILAQIASGPLKSYLTGSINCLKTLEISNDVLLGELSAIEEPPYIPRLIKQAKAILDVHKVEINRWYQGEKAWATADNVDISFKSIVSAIRDAERDKLEKVAKELAADVDIECVGSDDNIDAVLEMVASKDNF